MLMIRSKVAVSTKRTKAFSLSDLIKWILAMPFLIVAATVMKFFEEVVIALVLIPVVVVYAYFVTDGSISAIFNYMVENLNSIILFGLAIFYFFKAMYIVDDSNKKYD